MAVLIENFASAQLLLPATDIDTEFTVNTSQGEFFPSPTGDDYSVLVIEDVQGAKEICHLTSRTGDVLAVTREEENTTAIAYAIGTRVELRLTKGFLEEFVDGGTF